MMLQKGFDVFPECKGLPIFCHGCKLTQYSEETISVSQLREKENGGLEMVQFLSCYSCVLTKTSHFGRC